MEVSEVVIDFRTVSTHSSIRAGQYRLLEIRNLAGSWMLARCIPLHADATDMPCWECPLSPTQSRQLAELSESSEVLVDLREMDQSEVSLPPRSVYRATFSAYQA